MKLDVRTPLSALIMLISESSKPSPVMAVVFSVPPPKPPSIREPFKNTRKLFCGVV
uniref:Inositol-pentakisphosphate 2-kinase-like n=1 Tax=Rhizophora mucronata TaxID=61149 RepID=A0A2P2MT27_RHIMU